MRLYPTPHTENICSKYSSGQDYIWLGPMDKETHWKIILRYQEPNLKKSLQIASMMQEGQLWPTILYRHPSINVHANLSRAHAILLNHWFYFSWLNFVYIQKGNWWLRSKPMEHVARYFVPITIKHMYTLLI